MSSGPGILQKKILDILTGQHSFVFQRVLLWQIAYSRDEIEKTGTFCPGIDSGYIKKSFSENLRRAVLRLEETGHVEIRDEKLTDLKEAFDYFPYHTSQLEIHELRKKLFPSIVEYINENKPHRYWYYDIEKKQISNIKGSRRFRNAVRAWSRIEKNILTILHDRDTGLFDDWLECLVRGRYLFFGRKFKHTQFLAMFSNAFERQELKTAIELETIKLLRDLTDSTFDKEDWDIGKLKSVYYGIADFQKGYSDNLDEKVKRHLRDKHRDLITSLPGHEEPELPKDAKSRRVLRAYREVYLRKIKYSKYLDKLVTRQILKRHRRIMII